MEESYDVETDAVFMAWKSLKQSVDKEEKDRLLRIRKECERDVSTKSARKELLKIPVALRKKATAKRFAGSYHVNSDDSLAALEQKQKEKDEKQKNILDRKAARELKKKGKEKNNTNKTATKKKPERPATKQTDSNECQKCGGKYIGDQEEPPWIACEACDDWFHVRCTDIDDDDIDLSELDFYCEACL